MSVTVRSPSRGTELHFSQVSSRSDRDRWPGESVLTPGSSAKLPMLAASSNIYKDRKGANSRPDVPISKVNTMQARATRTTPTADRPLKVAKTAKTTAIAVERPQVLEVLERGERERFTGRLEISSPDGTEWNFYYRLGRLVWATGGSHPIRRWRRYLARHCPQVDVNRLGVRQDDRVCDILYHILLLLEKRQVITREQVTEIVAGVAREVAFEVVKASQLMPLNGKSYAQDVPDESLALLKVGPIVEEAVRSWETWYAKKLAGYSPELAPAIRDLEALKQVASVSACKKLSAWVDGKSTIWDLSLRLDIDIARIALSLLPFVRQDIVEFVELPDLPPPIVRTGTPTDKPPVERRKPERSRPLIACIDDSPLSCKLMEEILTEAGYRCLTVTDSLKALPMLIAQPPDLIFLDLIMPVANGYEICSQFRRVSQFQDLPIVILTSKDSPIDRMRSKVVRASGFLSKPIDAEKVLGAIEKFVPVDR